MKLYIEGGDDSKLGQSRCREGFRKLFERAGFEGRMPRLIASGTRSAAFKNFVSAYKENGRSVAMLVDSEDPVNDPEKPWEHLKNRPDDNWDKPAGAGDEQVLLMTTCMETWIVADRAALKENYSDKLQANALPPLNDLEKRSRQDVQDALARATSNCSSAYSKGKHSFMMLGTLNPATLKPLLPSFARIVRILKQNL